MAEKPRVKAPKQRQTTSSEASSRRRTLTIAAAIAGVVAGFAAVALLLGLVGGTDTGEAALPAKFEEAGCTFRKVPALEAAHSAAPSRGRAGSAGPGRSFRRVAGLAVPQV